MIPEVEAAQWLSLLLTEIGHDDLMVKPPWTADQWVPPRDLMPLIEEGERAFLQDPWLLVRVAEEYRTKQGQQQKLRENRARKAEAKAAEEAELYLRRIRLTKGLCLCGCDKPATRRSHFAYGHAQRQTRQGPAPCRCGCGARPKLWWSVYLPGHHNFSDL